VWIGLLVFGLWQHYSKYYEAWIFMAVGFVIYQQILIVDRIPEKCFKAFLNHHWFVMWVWIGFVVA
jgi:4-hydroxybenzoate polyprenyltransferase